MGEIQYIRTNSNIPSIKKIWLINNALEYSERVSLFDNYISETLLDNIKVPNVGFLCYSFYDNMFYYPPGVKLLGNKFYFSVGDKSELVEIYVDLANYKITLTNTLSEESIECDIDYSERKIPSAPESAQVTCRIWTLYAYDDGTDSEIGVYSYDLEYVDGATLTPPYNKNNPYIINKYKGAPYPEPESVYKTAILEGETVNIKSPALKSNYTDGLYLLSYFIENRNYSRLFYDELFIEDYSIKRETRPYLKMNTSIKDLIDDEPVEEGGDEGPDYPPNEPDKPSTPGIYPDDDIVEPDLPDINITDGGFITLYNPSIADLQNLAEYLWSDAFSLNSFKKLFGDVMDAIIGLSIVPCAVNSQGTRAVKVGNISTLVTMPVVNSQWVKVDCGSVMVNEQWASYVDYNPHTKVSIFLPYIGINQLNTDDIVGATVHVVYHIDVLTGSLVCYLLVTKNGHERILYTYNGQCSVNVPLSSVNYSQMMASVVGAAVTAVTGGSAGAVAVGAGKLFGDTLSEKLKPDISRSGSFSQSCGFLGVQYPYLIFERPVVRIPESYEQYRGVASQITGSIASSRGFTVVDDINLNGLNATAAEKDEIIRLLKGGVIV